MKTAIFNMWHLGVVNICEKIVSRLLKEMVLKNSWDALALSEKQEGSHISINFKKGGREKFCFKAKKSGWTRM